MRNRPAGRKQRRGAGIAMKLGILHLPDCPNTARLMSRLNVALAGLDVVKIETRVIHDQDEAATWGMTGSPTLLIDGIDPFAVPGRPASLSCRLYRDETGTLSAAPSLGQLRAALADSTTDRELRDPGTDPRPG